MSDDRELVDRLAAINATPRARWVAELRADLDAAWTTGHAGHLHSLRTTTVTLLDHEPTPTEPTSGRRLPILIATAAAVVLVVGALVVVAGDGSEIEAPAAQPSNVSSATTVDTSSTELVLRPLDPIDCELELCPWSPELVNHALELPIACNESSWFRCPNLAVSPDGTLVALDSAAGTLTWFEDESRVVPLVGELRRSVDEAELLAIGPHGIAYIAIPDYYFAVAPSGAEITRVAWTSRQPTPVYATATGLVTGPRSRWPSPNAALDMPWVDLAGNPITDTRPYPTATATDAGIEIRFGEREWLLANEPGTRPRALEFLPRSDGGVVIVFDTWSFGQHQPATVDDDAPALNLLELSPDGTVERYFVDTAWPPIVLPDGSLIVEHNSQPVLLTR